MNSEKIQLFLENNITEYFSYLGAIQGLVLAVVVLFYPERHKVSNWLLSIFLLFFAHLLVATRITEAVSSDLVFMIYGIRFLANIALLFFIKSLYQNIVWKKQGWHLVVILLDNVVIYNRVSGSPLFLEGIQLEIFTVGWYFLVSFFYLFLVFRAYQEYREKVLRNFSSLNNIGLKFVHQIIIFMSLLILIDLVYAIVYFGFDGRTGTYHRLMKTLISTVFMYFIAIKGKLTPQIYQLQKIVEAPEHTVKELGKIDSKEEISAEIQLVGDSVIALMENEKFYKEENISIKDVAEKIEERPYIVSQAINTCLGKNFFDLINSYRVEEAKILMLDEKLAHLSMIGIAFEAGFSSKTAFNTAFKKHTGMTPSQFKKESSYSD
ncbi:helix-turn-helix domain-containing protein [Pararhodonellum marinum]|uniref:helix-turn-helix domain-containing protein n=1 Tax=Pararhodonellum marinum TaxID=2755358 RepID=UPI0018903D08|nr:helix-turn-helix domain-containing protein [Pararhodonellum marinum]